MILNFKNVNCVLASYMLNTPVWLDLSVSESDAPKLSSLLSSSEKVDLGESRPLERSSQSSRGAPTLLALQLVLRGALLRELVDSNMSLILNGVCCCLVEVAGAGDGVPAATLAAGDELEGAPQVDTLLIRTVAGTLLLELHSAAASGWWAAKLKPPADFASV